MIQYIQLRVGVAENLVQLLVEVAVLVGQSLGQVFLVNTRDCKQAIDGKHAVERTSPVWTDSSRRPIHDPHIP